MDGFLRGIGDWLLTLGKISLPKLTREMHYDAVGAKFPSAGGFDGCGWNDFRALRVGWLVWWLGCNFGFV